MAIKIAGRGTAQLNKKQYLCTIFHFNDDTKETKYDNSRNIYDITIASIQHIYDIRVVRQPEIAADGHFHLVATDTDNIMLVGTCLLRILRNDSRQPHRFAD